MASSSFALDFLRRLLCARSDGRDAAEGGGGAVVDGISAPEPEGGTTRRSPCVVARLMGLDAMPPSPAAVEAEWGRRSPRGHRYPSAAAALRDKQAYLRPENDMFLLLSFSPEERGTTETARDDEADDDDDRESGPDGGGASRKQKTRRARRRKLRFGGNDDDDEPARRGCAAQSSSPVSVLEARDVLLHEESSTTTTTTSSSLDDAEPCSATSEESHFASEQQQQSTPRNLQKQQPHTSIIHLDATSPPATTTTTTTTVHASTRSERERRRMMNRCDNDTAPADLPMIGRRPVVRGLVEEDLIKNAEWVTTRADGGGGSGVDVVVAEMGSEILDRLVCEATVELVQLCSGVACALPCLSPSPVYAQRIEGLQAGY